MYIYIYNVVTEIHIYLTKISTGTLDFNTDRFTAKSSDKDVFMQKLKEIPGGQIPPHFVSKIVRYSYQLYLSNQIICKHDIWQFN